MREQSEDPFFFPDHDHDKILADRIRFYVNILENLPSHRWFNEVAKQAMHKQVMQMVLLEIEWENYTRDILTDWESNRKKITDRDKCHSQLNKLYRNLGLTQAVLSTVITAADEDEGALIQKRMEFLEKHT